PRMSTINAPGPGEFTVSVKFDSDWHIGVGHGRGAEIDAATVRDADGLPFVPAKSMVGVLRDTATTIARELDASAGMDADTAANRGRGQTDETRATWAHWLMYLFGSTPGAAG